MASFPSLFDPPSSRPYARQLALRTRATPNRLRRHMSAVRARRSAERT